MFSIVAVLVCIPTNSVRGFPFLLCLLLLFFSQLFVRPLQTSFVFLHFFFLGIVLITACYTVSQTSVHRSSVHSSFLIGSFIFLELSCRSCLYIFEISCLPVASFATIFSHSEGCLFTLLIVSFVVQKLLILIRSHLFIFAFISNILGGGS